MSTVLNVIQDVFGDDLGPDLIHKIPAIPTSRLYKFREHYREFSLAFRLPLKQGDHLRPFMTYRAIEAAEWCSDFSLSVTAFQSADISVAAEEQVEAIKRHLLYCHSLTLHDPLPFILDCFFPNWAGTESRKWLQNYLVFLNQIRPLIENGSVFFLDEIPYTHLNPYGRNPEALGGLISWLWPEGVGSQIKALVETADLRDLPDDLRSRPWPVHPMRRAVMSIEQTLLANEFYDGNLDFYFPASYFRDALRGLVTHVRQWAKISDHDLLVLEQLLSVEVPALADLEIQEMVRIRQGEAAR